MNIKSLFQSFPVQARPENSPAMPENNPSEDAHRPRLRIVRDRVIISGRARSLLDEMRQAPDVETGIKALLGATLLPDTRATEVLDRIQHGFYSQPAVLKEVASHLGGALEEEPSALGLGAH
jgi:hypothetical protein